MKYLALPAGAVFLQLFLVPNPLHSLCEETADPGVTKSGISSFVIVSQDGKKLSLISSAAQEWSCGGAQASGLPPLIPQALANANNMGGAPHSVHTRYAGGPAPYGGCAAFSPAFDGQGKIAGGLVTIYAKDSRGNSCTSSMLVAAIAHEFGHLYGQPHLSDNCGATRIMTSSFKKDANGNVVPKTNRDVTLLDCADADADVTTLNEQSPGDDGPDGPGESPCGI